MSCGLAVCAKSLHSFRRGNQTNWSMAFTTDGLDGRGKPRAAYSIIRVELGAEYRVPITQQPEKEDVTSSPPLVTALTCHPECWGPASPCTCRWISPRHNTRGWTSLLCNCGPPSCPTGQQHQGHPLEIQTHTRHSTSSWEMDFPANPEMENRS